jgi:hypothetical protein
MSVDVEDLDLIAEPICQPTMVLPYLFQTSHGVHSTRLLSKHTLKGSSNFLRPDAKTFASSAAMTEMEAADRAVEKGKTELTHQEAIKTLCLDLQDLRALETRGELV